MTYVNGVDVAEYQPPTFSTKGLGFVFVKATQSNNYTNPDYQSQISTSRKGQNVTGHYHFLVPGNITGQISYFVSHSDVKPGDLIACDWESLDGAWPSDAEKTAWLKAIKAKFPKNRVGLYTNRDGWLNHDTSSYCGDFLWIADPGASKPHIQHAWTFWQTGSVSINGEQFDADVANFQSVDALKSWAGYPTSIPVTPTAVTQAYHDVMRNDVFPLPEGFSDPDGAWTLETVISKLFDLTVSNNAMLKQIVAEIEANKSA